MPHALERIRRTAALLSAWAVCAVSLAQEQHFFDRIGMAEGLPGKRVLALYQDAGGLVWIGTDNGLARHEGVRIRSWHHDRKDLNSLSNEQVNSIAQDRVGRIWVGTANGISVLDPGTERFQRIILPAKEDATTRANRVMYIVTDVAGEHWVGTEAGIYRLSVGTGEIAPPPPGNDPVSRAMQEKSLSQSLVPDSMRQGLWLAAPNGLFFQHSPTGQWYHAGNDPHGWGCFDTVGTAHPLLMRDGRLLWFDQAGLRLIDCNMRGQRREVEEAGGERMRFTTRVMAQDHDGGVWMSTWTGRTFLFTEDLSRNIALEPTDERPSGMPKGGAHAMLMDRHGSRWFGTASGIALFDPTRQHLRIRVPLSGMSLQGVAGRVGDTLLLATAGNGLLLYDTRHDRVQQLLPEDPDQQHDPDRWALHVTSALPLDDGSFFIGTHRGLFQLDPQRTRLSRPQGAAAMPNNLLRYTIRRMIRDRQGRIWIATWHHGVYRRETDGGYTRFHQKAIDPRHRLPINMALSLLESRDGDLWIGLNDGGGLQRLPGSEGPAEPHFHGTGTDALYAVVTCLAEDAEGYLWMGTHQGGVDRLDPRTGNWRTWTRSDGLPSDRIGGLLFDRSGGLWATTSLGMAYLPPDKDRFIALRPPVGIPPYGIGSQLTSTAEGLLVVTHEDKLLMLDPGQVMRPPAPPEVTIMRVQHPMGITHFPPPGSTLRLPHDRRTLVIEAATTHTGPPGEVLLAYRIPTIDSAWHAMDPQGRLELLDLPTGRHPIELRASFNAMDWSEPPTTIQVHVPPPVWATWWFRGLLLLSIAGVVALTFRSYLQQKLAAQRITFEREQALMDERMRIASDMHDDLGAGLSALKLRSEITLRTETDPLKRTQLTQLATTAGELITSMRQIIWAMNQDQGSLEDLVAYGTSYARGYLAGHGLACDIHAEGPWPDVQLSAQQRRNLFLVLKESLHNTVKHAKATRVSLHMGMEGDTLEMAIRDDGIGLNGSATGGNGLRNMQRRMGQLGGSLVLTSDAQERSGTCVRALWPMK